MSKLGRRLRGRKKGGRPKGIPYVVRPGDPLGKWGAFFVHRGEPLLQLAPLGPNVKASNPEELRERTDDALVDLTKGQKPT